MKWSTPGVMFVLMIVSSCQASIIVVEDGDVHWSLGIRANDHLLMTGGRIGNRLQLYDHTTGDIFGGWSNALFLGGHSPATASANVYSGTYINTYIGTYNSTVLNLYGGRMPDRYVVATEDSLINLFVKDYLYDPVGGSFGGGRVTGHWRDESFFQFDLRDQETYRHLHFHPVPAPSSFVNFLGLGIAFLCYRRWRQSTNRAQPWVASQ